MLLITLALQGCNTNVAIDSDAKLCSNFWYEWVDTIISTRDSHQHGPDIGSSEWKRVIEFKLNLTNQTLPERDSYNWCVYINRVIINNSKEL